MKTRWKITAGTSFLFGLTLIASLLAGGCQTPKQNVTFPPVPASDTNNVGSHDATDRFTVGDLITLQFSGTVDAIPPYAERIKEDGTIALHLIGTVRAAGKTPAELYREIYDLYVPRYYKHLAVSPSTIQRVYYVGGQVRSPGRQAYLGITTITKAIQSAGAFTDFAAKTRVELTRPDGKVIQVNCVKAMHDPSLDLPIYPGDKITVPMRTWRHLFQ